MKELIKKSCSNTHDAEDIEKGRYHLVASGGQFILPMLWDKLVKPGMKLQLSIWQNPCQEDTSKLVEEDTAENEAPVLFMQPQIAASEFRWPWTK
ncbi:hypothetical protein VM1G_01119 [Cytospora mali]|uniref:Ubiquitin-like domain-containing protein n=1 Tax=Cytospora mali TaxID=578113 RepID=A0A194VM24_CYTMA|nr:hypothetical protein VM1G_01119 [Valsa mali]